MRYNQGLLASLALFATSFPWGITRPSEAAKLTASANMLYFKYDVGVPGQQIAYAATASINPDDCGSVVAGLISRTGVVVDVFITSSAELLSLLMCTSLNHPDQLNDEPFHGLSETDIIAAMSALALSKGLACVQAPISAAGPMRQKTALTGMASIPIFALTIVDGKAKVARGFGAAPTDAAKRCRFFDYMEQRADLARAIMTEGSKEEDGEHPVAPAAVARSKKKKN